MTGRRSHGRLSALNGVVHQGNVEQKLLFPLLTAGTPLGLGLGTPDILTKMSIRRLEIDKGSRRRLYFPDYNGGDSRSAGRCR